MSYQPADEEDDDNLAGAVGGHADVRRGPMPVQAGDPTTDQESLPLVSEHTRHSLIVQMTVNLAIEIL